MVARPKKLKLKVKKILITGTAGFIGFHLADYILNNYDVKVVGIDSITDYYDIKIKHVRNEILQKNPNYTFYKSDIADYKQLEKIVKKEKPEMIVHLAAQGGVRYSLKNPWAYVDSNYLGTLNIFEVAKRENIKRVLFASSSSVYGNNKKQPFSESDVTDQPISIYAASKKANELLAYSYNHLFKTEVIGLRFFTVYGTYGRPDLALLKFTKSIINDKPINVFNGGKMTRTFTHISDIIQGVVAAMEKENVSFEIYNLGGGETVSLIEFIELIEKNIGKKAKMNMLPMQAGDVQAASADISKAMKELGYNPKTSIKDGVAEFVNWFKENNSWLSKLKDSE